MPGWTKLNESSTALPAPGAMDLDAFDSVEELETVGMCCGLWVYSVCGCMDVLFGVAGG